MKEKEKQRKFHEALLKMMYPTPSPRHEDEEKEDEVEHKFLDLSSDLPEDEELENEATYSSSPSGGTDDKLTRAQRKRLRKRKLKESASKRRAIIGPLLPGSNEDVIASGVPEGVRQNAATNVSGKPPGCGSKRNKLRQRRKSKNRHGVGSEEAE